MIEGLGQGALTAALLTDEGGNPALPNRVLLIPFNELPYVPRQQS